MRIYINEKYIEKRAKTGRRLSLLGLAVLGVGMLASFSPGVIGGWIQSGNPTAQQPWAQWLFNGGWAIVSMFALLVGFLLGQVGNAYMRRFVKSPRPDEILTKALKGFDDRNHFYAWATPGELVFAGPSGLYAFVTRSTPGEIRIEGDKASQPFSITRVLFSFSQESVGRPMQEAQSLAQSLQEWLTKQLGEDNALAVKPLVVFVDERVKLDVKDPLTPVLLPKQLKQYLRNQLRSERIPKNALAEAVKALNAEAERRGAARVN
ncbi:MAG: hypothetical protein GXP42_13155 [Chloroflexi bacterium]|nr:hypothetical protein [Chloroflexota bacterium]